MQSNLREVARREAVGSNPGGLATSEGRPLPLAGIRVVEMGGIGPGPFAGMVLAGMGAEVHRVSRPGNLDPAPDNTLLRGRVVHEFDLKTDAGHAAALELVAGADAVYECFRPGVMERLRLGPEQCRVVNDTLVYCRMTGWGQSGPYVGAPGHDINYLAVSGVLNTIGPAGGDPVVPVNYVADYGAGGMLLVAGLLGGLVRRHSTGLGSVVDVAMVDGAAMMLSDLLFRLSTGDWQPARGTNVFDGGAHFYRSYRTADDRYMAVGAIEPKFYADLLDVLDLDDVDPAAQYDRSTWSALTKRLAEAFASRPQSYWCKRFEGRSACVSPVLGWEQLADDPHLRSRGTFTATGDTLVPAAAPRFSNLSPTVGSRPAVGSRPL